MTHKFHPFDIGIEREFFISSPQRYHSILNAKEEMRKLFGFSIDQNDGYSGIPIGNWYDLVTDGTALELRGFFRTSDLCSSSGYGQFIKGFYKDSLSKIGLLEKYWIHFNSLISTADRSPFPSYTFDNPNNVFCSEKEVHCAYTGKSWHQEKKDEDKKVTTRTAGLHVHFSFAETFKQYDEILFKKGNEHLIYGLVKLWDKLYKQFFHLTEEDRERIDQYQPFGIFRIKNRYTKSGLHTIEYRQPSSPQLDRNFNSFLTLCQISAYNYLVEKEVIK